MHRGDFGRGAGDNRRRHREQHCRRDFGCGVFVSQPRSAGGQLRAFSRPFLGGFGARFSGHFAVSLFGGLLFARRRSFFSYRRRFSGRWRHFFGHGRGFAGSRRRFFGHGRSFAGSRRRFFGHRRSFAGSRRRFFSPGRSFAGSRRRFFSPGRSFAGSRRRFFSPRRSFAGSRRRFFSPRRSFAGSRRRFSSRRGRRFAGSRRRFFSPRRSFAGSRRRFFGGGNRLFWRPTAFRCRFAYRRFRGAVGRVRPARMGTSGEEERCEHERDSQPKRQASFGQDPRRRTLDQLEHVRFLTYRPSDRMRATCSRLDRVRPRRRARRTR